MSHQQIPFEISPMTVADIPTVTAIEQAAYAPNRPQRAYKDELERNHLAHYFVLRALPSEIQAMPTPLLADDKAAIIGVGGFWLITTEIHIITIAVHPDWRGKGLGEWLLNTLIEKGQNLSANTATLEVRPSNHIAQSLYQKYGFQEVGRRIGYYNDNGEDALILTVPSVVLPDYQAMLTQRKSQLLQRLAQIGDRQNNPD